MMNLDKEGLMKRIAMAAVFSLLLSGVVISACTQGTSVKPGQTAYVVDTFVGEVTISRDAGNSWKPIEIGMLLMEEDIIRTGRDSFVDIIMPDRGIFRISYESTVHLKKLALKMEQISVKKGKLFVNITEKLEGDETFKVETDVAVVAVRGTQFSVETDGDTTTATVNEGMIKALENIDVEADTEVQQSIEEALEVDVTQDQSLVFDKDSTEELEKEINQQIKGKDKDEVVDIAKGLRTQKQPKRTQAMKKDKDVWDTLTKEEKKELIRQQLDELRKKKEEEKKDREMLDQALQKVRGKESLADKYVDEKQTTTAQDQEDRLADKVMDKYKQKQGQDTTSPQAEDSDDLINKYKTKKTTTAPDSGTEDTEDSGSLIDKYKKKKSTQ